MKWSFKILAIVAAVALLPLQYILLLKVYKSLESNLYVTVDECFRNAVEEESIARFDHILDSSSVYADIVSSSRNTLIAPFVRYAHPISASSSLPSIGSPPAYQKLYRVR